MATEINSTTELKPCPFCGGKTKGPHEVTYGDCHPDYAYWIECKDCEAYMEMDTEEEVVSAWNRRIQ